VNISGITVESAFQDFYATLYLVNMVVFATNEADDITTKKDESKSLKFARKSNRSRAVRNLTKRYIMKDQKN
jgi:hypothetical protein